MSDKFDMKLVIDAVTTPLLHARLSQANSYRERAALLRSLAEAALRGSSVASRQEYQVTTRDLPVSPRESNVVHPALRDSPAPAIRVEVVPAEVSELRFANENDPAPSHDVDQLADAFGGFF